MSTLELLELFGLVWLIGLGLAIWLELRGERSDRRRPPPPPK